MCYIVIDSNDTLSHSFPKCERFTCRSCRIAYSSDSLYNLCWCFIKGSFYSASDNALLKVGFLSKVSAPRQMLLLAEEICRSKFAKCKFVSEA